MLPDVGPPRRGPKDLVAYVGLNVKGAFATAPGSALEIDAETITLRGVANPVDLKACFKTD